jgi:hypothetical protein
MFDVVNSVMFPLVAGRALEEDLVRCKIQTSFAEGLFL